MRTRCSSSMSKKLTSMVLIAAMATLGCPVPSEGASMSGLYDYQRGGHVNFRYGIVNTLGGNLMVSRVDLSLDTLIGPFEIGRVYNSTTQQWIWSFDESYKDGLFVDSTGAFHEDVDKLNDGQSLVGTTWVRSDASRIKSNAGLVHQFRANGSLQFMYWGDHEGLRYPFVGFREGPVGGSTGIVGVFQCVAASLCHDVATISYDPGGRVVAIEDFTGRRAEFAYDGTRLAGALSPLDVAESRPGFSYEYDFTGLLTAITNGEGERTEIDYSGDRVIEVVDIGEGNPTQTFFYEGKVNGLYATRYWDALGYEHIYRFDGFHRLMDIENVSLAEHTAWTYSLRRPTSMTDAAGVTTSYTWSGGDLITEIQPSGNVVTYTYAPAGTHRPNELLSLFDREGLGSAGHRPFLRVEDSVGLIEERTYGADGELLSFSDGVGDTWNFAYLPWGALSHIEAPNGAFTGLSSYGKGFFDGGDDGWHGFPLVVQTDSIQVIRQLFDNVGNRLTGAGNGLLSDGGVEGRTYDDNRNVRSILLVDDDTISIDVRSDGLRTGIQRPGGDDHSMAYDDFGRMESRSEKVDGVWQTTTFEYDAVGRRTAVERPNGMRQDIEYDAAGRATSLTNSRLGVTESYVTMAYTNGQLSSKYDSVRDGTAWYFYDTAGRLKTVEHEDGTSTYRAYDLRSRATLVDYVDADLMVVRSIGRSYDNLDRETEVFDGAFRLIGRTYATGALSGAVYGNGLTRTYAHDRGRLTGSTTLDATSAVVETTSVRTDWEWFDIDMIVTASTTTSGGVSASTVESYTLSSVFDSGQVAFQPNSRVGATGADSLSYDSQSNLLAEGTTSFAYNAEGNRLMSVTPSGASSLTYTYDDAGFTTSRDGKPITWTADGRIASHGTDSFVWDALGAPISSTVNGTTVTSLFGGAVVGDELGVPVKINGDEYSIDLQGGGHLYRHYDFRGNVKFTSGNTGLILAHYEYSAFGLEAVYGATDDPVRFVGRTEIGELMLLGARIYDPLSGRFLSPDPVFQDINQYAYTLGNPIWWWDPDGAEPTPANMTAGLGAVSGLIAATAAILGATAFALAFGFIAALFAVIAVALVIFASCVVPLYDRERLWQKRLLNQAHPWRLAVAWSMRSLEMGALRPWRVAVVGVT